MATSCAAPVATPPLATCSPSSGAVRAMQSPLMSQALGEHSALTTELCVSVHDDRSSFTVDSSSLHGAQAAVTRCVMQEPSLCQASRLCIVTSMIPCEPIASMQFRAYSFRDRASPSRGTLLKAASSKPALSRQTVTAPISLTFCAPWHVGGVVESSPGV